MSGLYDKSIYFYLIVYLKGCPNELFSFEAGGGANCIINFIFCINYSLSARVTGGLPG